VRTAAELILIAVPEPCTRAPVDEEPTPKKTARPAIPSFPTIPTSSHDVCDSPEIKEIIESLGKYTYLITSPGSYNSSPKTKLTVVNLGNKRLYSFFGSVASSRLTPGLQLVLVKKANVVDSYTHTAHHAKQYVAPGLCANTHTA
jgi:hypothetical protein